MSLLEVVVGMCLLVLLVGGLLAFTKAGVESGEATTAITRLDQEAQRVLSRIVDELRLANVTTDPVAAEAPLGASSLSYRQLISFDGGVLQYGPISRLEFQLDPQELDDGIDNNGNDIVDEGRVVLIHQAGTVDERMAVLCSGVAELLAGETPNGLDDNGNGLIDEQGLSFEYVGETILVRLTLNRPAPNGQVLRRTVDTAVTPRN